ncbi:uncharacterized protein LOC117565135 [Drosophila albomicans]|uniref:Uncharacterized protein LOC117565135 n=1 Tax=Drosophila albomicans TaxID=7291 RepID=A0A6P8W8N9_DROAB|nr:uncharacterized protein LOC117565135 [Drosophila albomicans]
MSLDDLFYKMKQRHPGITEHIWQTLVNAKCTSPATSITLSQIRAGYYDITEERFPRMGDPRTEMLFLLSIPFIASFSNRVGTIRFYIIEDPELSY